MLKRKLSVLSLVFLAFLLIIFLSNGGCKSNSINRSSISNMEIDKLIKEFERDDPFPSAEQLSKIMKLLELEKVEISDANNALIHLAVVQLAKVTGYEIDDRDGFNHSYIEEKLASFKKFALRGGLDKKK